MREEYFQSPQPLGSMMRDSKRFELTKADGVREFIMQASITFSKITRGKIKTFACVHRKSCSPQG